MADKKTIQEKLEKVYARYPEERGRVEEVGRKVVEMNRWMVTKALNHALQKIIDAKTPSEAKRHIDTLDYLLVTSSSFTSIGKIDKIFKKLFIKPYKVFLVLALVSFLVSLLFIMLGI